MRKKRKVGLTLLNYDVEKTFCLLFFLLNKNGRAVSGIFVTGFFKTAVRGFEINI